jgi:hypothetical protein
MNIIEMMKENEIELEWLFTLAKLEDKEGLMYFNPVTEVIDEVEATNLDPKCILVDGAKFIYDDEMDNKITVNSVDDVISFTRVDGIQLNINTNEIAGFPFNVSQFKNQAFEFKTNVPEDYVEIEA